MAEVPNVCFLCSRCGKISTICIRKELIEKTSEYKYNPHNESYHKVSLLPNVSTKDCTWHCAICGAEFKEIEQQLVKIQAFPISQEENDEFLIEVEEKDPVDLIEILTNIQDEVKPIGCAIDREEVFTCSECGAENDPEKCKELMAEHGTHYIFPN